MIECNNRDFVVKLIKIKGVQINLLGHRQGSPLEKRSPVKTIMTIIDCKAVIDKGATWSNLIEDGRN